MTNSHSLDAKPARAAAVGATPSSTQPVTSTRPTANSGTIRLIISTMAPSRSQTKAHRWLAAGHAAIATQRPGGAHTQRRRASPGAPPARSAACRVEESVVRPVASRAISVDSRGPVA